MPRSWEYSKARRIAMQVVLCAILLISLFFAWAITHRHESELLPRQFESRSFGKLVVELPRDWEPLPLGDGAVKVYETHGAFGVNRTLTLRAESIRAGSNTSARQIAVKKLGDLLGDESINSVDFLGQHGVIVEIPPREDSEGYRSAFMFACVVLPSHQVVTVEMDGMHLISRADHQLFERILRSLQVNGRAEDTVAAGGELRKLTTPAI